MSDLPTNLTAGWQGVDMAIRCLRVALRAEDMQQTPKVVAVLQSCENTMTKLLSAYTSAAPAASSSMPDAGTTSDTGQAPAPDADAQPGADSGTPS